jgi:glycerophosphoryl diester phosphodiesterase
VPTTHTPDGPPTFPYLDHPGPIPFAHRGGAGEAPENSLAAFTHATNLGYRYLETDLHATADGVLLTFHDRRLRRVTGGRGRLAHLPYSRVRPLRIAGREPIPRLTDLLTAFPAARINLDVKEPNAIAPLAAAISAHHAAARVCLTSFSDRRLAAARDLLGPTVCSALGPRELYRLWRASRRGAGPAALDRLRLPPNARCVQVPAHVGHLARADARLVAAAHHAGLVVHVWTVNDEALMHRLLDLGVDGIMTDRLTLLRRVLRQRGQWHDPRPDPHTTEPDHANQPRHHGP